MDSAGEEIARGLALRPAQWTVYSDPHRFRILIAGRRFGKTFLARTELLSSALSQPGARCRHVFPTYRQGREVAWEDLKSFCWHYSDQINETTMTIQLAGGSEIAIRGADDPDRLRGSGLDFVVLDEWADQKAGAWYEVLRPALADRQGRALFVGTPRGMHNHFYDLVVAAEEDPEWSIHRFTTIEGGNVPDSEVTAARASLDERTFRQEFEATWEAMGNRVAYAFDHEHNVRDDLVDTGGDLFVGMDFNVNPMSAVLGVVAGDELHVLDEIEIHNSGTEEMAQAILNRVGEADYLEDRKPGGITVCPDPTGRARKTSAPVGQTDFTILRGAGFKIDAPQKAPPVADRLNDLHALCRSADGRRRFFVHPRCRKLIRAMDALPVKEGTNVPDKSSGLDHIFDACSYLISAQFPIRRTGHTEVLDADFLR